MGLVTGGAETAATMAMVGGAAVLACVYATEHTARRSKPGVHHTDSSNLPARAAWQGFLHDTVHAAFTPAMCRRLELLIKNKKAEASSQTIVCTPFLRTTPKMSSAFARDST